LTDLGELQHLKFKRVGRWAVLSRIGIPSTPLAGCLKALLPAVNFFHTFLRVFFVLLGMFLMVLWRTVNAVGRVKEVTRRRARLVLWWTTVFGRLTTSVYATQPPTLSDRGNEYRSKCGDALRLRSRDRHGSFHLWINVVGGR